MADLQDTNAATEKIYGPLHIEDRPVSNEMISQSTGPVAASTGESPFSCSIALLINHLFWVEASLSTATRKLFAGRKYGVGRKQVDKRTSETVRAIGGVERGREWLFTWKNLIIWTPIEKI